VAANLGQGEKGTAPAQETIGGNCKAWRDDEIRAVAAFIMIPVRVPAQFLVVALDAPAQFGGGPNWRRLMVPAGSQAVFRRPRSSVFGPLDQQPLLRMVTAPVVSMRHAHAQRGKKLSAGGLRVPSRQLTRRRSLAAQTQSQLFHESADVVHPLRSSLRTPHPRLAWAKRRDARRPGRGEDMDTHDIFDPSASTLAESHLSLP